MRRFAIAAGLLALGAAAAAAQTAQPTPDEQMRIDSAAQRQFYPMLPDTPGTGPYPALKTADPDFPGHVIYRPADLSRLGARKLPVLLWGNGGCSADGASARLFLAEVASHGYLVVAPGAILSGPGAPLAPPPPPASQPAPLGAKTSATDVLAGLDQAAAANARAGSALHGRIDLSRVAVSGTSCGGLQALQVAADPRVKAIVALHTGVFVNGGNPIPGMQVSKAMLLKLHTPILYILGGPMDVAYPNGSDDVAKIDHVPVMLADHAVRHLGTFARPNGGSEAQVTLDWLQWRLLGDAAAARTFVGEHCGLCGDPEWTLTRKRMG